ncbi:MAG: HEAT repeat domain-containing protein [Acidobacteriota bacterium]|nr:HEAT repeat domain-containing protein [Acidobacteriota bacterium]
MDSIPLFFNLIQACYEGTRKFSRGNAAVENYYGRLLATYKEFLDFEGKMQIDVGAGFIKINHNDVAPEVVRQPAVGWFVTQCLDRGIEQIVLNAGMNGQDVRGLVGLFLWDAGYFTGDTVAEKFLKEMGITRVEISQAPGFTSEPMESGPPEPVTAQFKEQAGEQALQDPLLEIGPAHRDHLLEIGPVHHNRESEPNPAPAVQTAPPQPVSMPLVQPDPAPATIDHSSRAPDLPSGPRTFTLDEPQPKRAGLFITEEDYRALYAGIAQAVHDQDLNRVGETLTMIRTDLASPSREDREIAFSSYHVVVRVLIDEGRNRQLFMLLKTLGTDLARCTEADLYALHLDTLVLIIRYFDKKSMTEYYLYGVDIICTQTLRQKGQIRNLLEEQSVALLTMSRLADLLTEKNQELQTMVRALLGKRGAGLLKPLLYALFNSGDRNMRKRLLEVLHMQGPVIYPELLVELQDAITHNQPWYVKRNLLTLLSIKPPKDLVPMLDELLKEEEHPKMRDLVCRCLYQIPHERAYSMGKRILRKADARQQVKLLGYLHVSRDPEYFSTVCRVFENSEVERVRQDALNVMGRMATEEAVDYLEKVVANYSRSKGKGEPSSVRMGAVRAMIASKQPKAMRHLLKHRKDPDKAVRALIQKALDATA